MHSTMSLIEGCYLISNRRLTGYNLISLRFFPVARRCVPTLVSNLDQILNLTASEEIQNATNNSTDVISNFGDLFTTLSIQSITDGTL